MPHSMTYYPEAIVLDEKVYVGAGSSSSYFRNNVVMVYNIPNDKWSLLPAYKYYWFGMTSLDNKLVLVGGVTQLDYRTNQLGIWNEELNNWIHTLPSMPTARSGPTVVTYKNRWITVAGGFDYSQSYHSTVEILDTRSGYWHRASPLPERQYKMSSTIIGNMMYLLGGFISSRSTLCICVCIDDLIYDAVFQTSQSPWRLLPDAPTSRATALGLNGALLAIGGNQCMTDIHLFKPSCNEWVKVGELHSDREECACAILPNGEIFIVGGDVDSGRLVDIGSLK